MAQVYFVSSSSVLRSGSIPQLRVSHSGNYWSLLRSSRKQNGHAFLPHVVFDLELCSTAHRHLHLWGQIDRRLQRLPARLLVDHSQRLFGLQLHLCLLLLGRDSLKADQKAEQQNLRN